MVRLGWVLIIGNKSFRRGLCVGVWGGLFFFCWFVVMFILSFVFKVIVMFLLELLVVVYFYFVGVN